MTFIGRIIFFLFVALIEWYFYQAVNTVIKDYSEFKRNIFRYTYFIVSGIVVLGVFVSIFYSFQLWPRAARISVGSFMMIVVLSQLIGIIFLLPDDIIRMFRWAYVKMFNSSTIVEEGGTKITRLKFFSYLSLAAAALPGAGMLYGFLWGGTSYRTHRVKLSFPNLPDAFDGLKIVQLSDIHTGSFMGPAPLVKAFNMVMDEKPDVIFFTGDLVNDLPEETLGFEEAYRILRAPLGVHSIFGNHDYGEYTYRLEEEAPKRKEAQEGLKKVHAAAGWNLLMNQHTYLERNGQKIGVIGVENWDARPGFSRHGDLEKAREGMEDVPFKILLSHSPSHWDAKVNKFHKDIDITFSGHTHGMQFGIDIPGFKWSPVQYFYKQWAGLYKNDDQYLYVNRGLGYIGYNGRLGIWPEITVIELRKGKKKYEEA